MEILKFCLLLSVLIGLINSGSVPGTPPITHVTRGCQSLRFGGTCEDIFNDLRRRGQVLPGQHTCATCSSDLCNSTNSFKRSFSVLLITSMACIFPNKMPTRQQTEFELSLVDALKSDSVTNAICGDIIKTITKKFAEKFNYYDAKIKSLEAEIELPKSTESNSNNITESDDQQKLKQQINDGVKWVHRSCRPFDVCARVAVKYNDNRNALIDCTTCSDRDLCNSSESIQCYQCTAAINSSSTCERNVSSMASFNCTLQGNFTSCVTVITDNNISRNCANASSCQALTGYYKQCSICNSDYCNTDYIEIQKPSNGSQPAGAPNKPGSAGPSPGMGGYHPGVVSKPVGSKPGSGQINEALILPVIICTIFSSVWVHLR
ncbi:unnamed protein product [Psylliodes chrysocephalus]|uniref:Uncharacterized protein n=1 Tax=Psylliodes chrysocephalus TaxID=3402493 RepID=A0A9P0CIK7_9CUCU|nr:unnamed protein product [Psylliodes chrysocephala]